MHAQAAPFAPSLFLDALFSAKEAIFLECLTLRNRKITPLASLRLHGENLLSMPRAGERLSLLAQLELPCTILTTSPTRYLRHTLIRTVDFGCESLAIHGDGFNLHLREPNFYTIRLVNYSDAGEGSASLDICHADGMLYASIQPTPDGKAAAIWRDVMENPTLCLA